MEDSSSLPLDDQSEQLNPMDSNIAPASETGHPDDLNQQPFLQQQAITRPPAQDSHQTGIFLQHFTNSVNRALHKQNCTCHGKSYTADELFSMSNTALCGGGSTNNTVAKPNATGRKKRYVTLPPIDDLNLSENGPPNITAAPLKNRLDREVTNSHDLSVGHSSPSSHQLTTTKEELRLPRIMNIRDNNGNTWKILQESRDGRHHHHGRGKLIRKPPKRFDQTNEYDDGEEDLQPRPQSIQVKIPTDEALELDAEHQENNGEQGKNEEASDAVIATVSKANTPMEAPVESKDIVKLYNDARGRDPHPTSTQILDPDFDAPIFDLAPVCTLAQIKDTKSKCANAYHDDFERKALLLKHNSDVRSRKTSHVEYLRLVSQMTLCPCLRGINFYGEELNRDVMSKQQRRRRNSDSPPASPEKRVLTAVSGLTFKSRSLGPPESALSFADSSRPVIYARKNYFSGELDNLYTRDGYKTATLQLNGSEQLPSNFLDKEREALRLMYPMYDWKVQQALNSMMRSSGEDTPRKVTTHPTPANTATSRKPSVLAKASLELNSKNHLQKEQSFEPDSVYQQHGHPEAAIGFASSSSSFVLKQVLQENDPSRKSRVIPNQPPTTPAVSTGGFSIILTSTSAPELLTIVESEVHEDKDVVDENNNPAVDDVEAASKQTQSITFGDGPAQDNASVTLEVEQNAESQQQKVPNDPGQQTGRQSIHNVSPASSATNSAIHLSDNMNVTKYNTNTSGQFRQPSVQCLQIDANVAVRRRAQRPLVVGTGENQTGKTMGRYQNLATDTKSAQTVTKMSTQKVVFVSPAAT